MQLAGEPLFAAVTLAASFDGGVERVERQCQALDRRIDCAGLRHRLPREKKCCDGRRLGQEPYVLRDRTVNVRMPLCPNVFAPLCMARRCGSHHIDSRGSHAIQPTQKAFSMTAKASPTAAVAPAGRREQPAAATTAAHDRMANAIRALAMDAVEQAKSGHPGLPMGAADIATVLFTGFLKFDAADPAWPDRDRFVLSAGHGSMLLYALLYLLGYEKVTIDEIKNFRQFGSRTPGHPEHGHTPGVETTTGPLGQGLANAVGMAIAERHLAAVFGGEVVDHTTYVLASDGDLMEGISQEAIALAGHLKLNKLIVLFDDNGISIDGPLALADSVDQVKRFEAAGWAASRIDGHDPQAIAAAIEAAKKSERPSLIACRTIIGFGAKTKAGTEKCHGAALGPEEVAAARQKLGWTAPAFDIPPAIRAQWRAAGERGRPARLAWQARRDALPAEKRAEFERRVRGEVPEQKLAAAVRDLKEKLAETPKEI